MARQRTTYGYIITKTMQDLLNVSESTMYPVLRRLKKDGYVETYDQPFEGRIRRYYKMTADGQAHLTEIKDSFIYQDFAALAVKSFFVSSVYV
ncbi:helix-turn-helix transcriptional regulator [Weissella confusa]|uniref:Helix-turn-helix transcriptional regulator n=1 Tax=Weissella confusa TaxID=1583 RepID=A0A923SU74_WEICO|nr:helix-turn-helix transcriptional regulator [Weissella confusa]